MQSVPSSLLRNHLFIDGQWCPADSGNRFSVTNPATGETLAEVADAGAAETHRAIAAAQGALPGWRNTSPQDRSRLLRGWYEAVMDHEASLALLLTLEQGKPLAEARGEIAYGASYIEWFAEEAKRIQGDLLLAQAPARHLLTLKQGVGVVAAITPWNFPNAMLARKLAPALAAGCTLVAKPAAETPLSALALVSLAQEAGFPNGTLNMITGLDAKTIGEAMTSSPQVRKLTFTGSTGVGRQLLAQSAADIKRVTLELGGNAPFIVFADADLEAAVEGAMASKFRNAGQTCVCANRFYVERGIYQAFSDRLAGAIAGLRVGDGREEGIDIGPLINGKALEKVERLVADALNRGARLTLGGTRSPLGKQFYQPTLLLDVSPEAELCREEIFGPVVALIPFDTEEEAIKLANATEFGLAAYVYTRDSARRWRLAHALECGMLGINQGLISTELAPFGGIKHSGMGREGSRYGLDDYLDIKYLCDGS